ncbi:MAG TPA: hypothetical protein VG269_09310 [Tepidisphaeraceae bacterium]|jgi:hypothetical protein|nr:hypothetical protein [Tepidisphaeraceae bacterium]
MSRKRSMLNYATPLKRAVPTNRQAPVIWPWRVAIIVLFTLLVTLFGLFIASLFHRI